MTVKEYAKKVKSQDEEARRIVIDIMEELAPGKVKLIDEDETSYTFKVGNQTARIGKNADSLLSFLGGINLGLKC